MRRRIGLLGLVAALITGSWPGAHAGQPAAAPPPPGTAAQPAVLFLVPEDFTRPYVPLLFESFSSRLSTSGNVPAIYFESLDAGRFEQPQYLGDLRDWLRRKYAGTRIDMIVAVGEDTLAFLAEAQGEPWPAAQVLYMEVGSVRVDVHGLLPQAGGLLLEDHFPDAIATIRRILPATTGVALLYGASSIELVRWAGFADKVRAAGLEPIALVGKSIDETLAAVAKLPPATVVLILGPSVDARGNVLPPNQACDLLADARTAPIFTLGAQDLGCGVVGGLLRDWTIVGPLMADEVQARLARPSAEVRHIAAADYTTLAFDDRQLQRWNIPERQLPAGAAVRFREPNLWRDYRGVILAALGVTAVQTLLIAGLAVERRRRRSAELESRRHLAAMAHLDRRAAMGELATSLAHELNQPLNAILQNAGVAQMLLTSSELPDEVAEVRDIINDIRKDDIRASEVIRRMRGLLQKHELKAEPVHINEVAQETAAIVRPDATSRGIHLDLDLADGPPPLLGDRVHIQQVLLNLLMNAVDAVAAVPAERRRVTLSTGLRDGAVHVAVADTGTGIAADDLSEIFEPFVTTKSEGTGMGMGLAIARSIVEAHGGAMAAANNPGGGATVSFSVPLAPGSA